MIPSSPHNSPQNNTHHDSHTTSMTNQEVSERRSIDEAPPPYAEHADFVHPAVAASARTRECPRQPNLVPHNNPPLKSAAGPVRFDEFLHPDRLITADQEKPPKRMGASWDVVRGVSKAAKSIRRAMKKSTPRK